jgi:hypothetical protein
MSTAVSPVGGDRLGALAVALSWTARPMADFRAGEVKTPSSPRHFVSVHQALTRMLLALSSISDRAIQDNRSLPIVHH